MVSTERLEAFVEACPSCDKGACLAPATRICILVRSDDFIGVLDLCDADFEARKEQDETGNGFRNRYEFMYAETLRHVVAELVRRNQTPWWFDERPMNPPAHSFDVETFEIWERLVKAMK